MLIIQKILNNIFKTNRLFVFLTVILLGVSFLFNIDEAEAKKRRKKRYKSRSRHYNPTKTKAEALLMIRANSNELAELAGLEPIDKSQLPKNLFANHSEIENIDELSEEEISALENDQDENDNDEPSLLADNSLIKKKTIEELSSNSNTTYVNYYDESKFDKDYFAVYDDVDIYNINSDVDYGNNVDDNNYYTQDGEIGDEGEDLNELSQDGGVMMSMEEFKNLWLAFVSDGKNNGETEAGIKKSEIMQILMDWFGTPYRFGAMSDNAIDCSAFTQRVYLNSADMRLPRTANEQFKVGKFVKHRSDLQFGDLVFFNTRKRVRVSHVGIYLGDNLFAHASSRSGVTVSSLEQDYYNRKYIGAKRINFETMNQFSIKPERIEEGN